MCDCALRDKEDWNVSGVVSECESEFRVAFSASLVICSKLPG